MIRGLVILIAWMTFLGVVLIPAEAEVTPIMGFDLGYNLYDKGTIGNPTKEIAYDYNESLSIQLLTGIKIGELRILGIYTNKLEAVKWDIYSPVQDKFEIDISYRFGDFNISFNHYCMHPVSDKYDIKDYDWNAGQRSINIGYYKEF